MSFHPIRSLFVGLLLLACAAPSLAQGVLIARVARVIDGDSVWLEQGGRRVELRLAGIDAPELQQPHGVQARAALRACASGRIATVQVTGTDRHGRTVGRLEAGGRECGVSLLQSGLAWHYQAFAGEQPATVRLRYAAAERAARQRRTGLWADTTPVPPWEWRRAHPRGARAPRR